MRMTEEKEIQRSLSLQSVHGKSLQREKCTEDDIHDASHLSEKIAQVLNSFSQEKATNKVSVIKQSTIRFV